MPLYLKHNTPADTVFINYPHDIQKAIEQHLNIKLPDPCYEWLFNSNKIQNWIERDHNIERFTQNVFDIWIGTLEEVNAERKRIYELHTKIKTDFKNAEDGHRLAHLTPEERERVSIVRTLYEMKEPEQLTFKSHFELMYWLNHEKTPSNCIYVDSSADEPIYFISLEHEGLYGDFTVTDRKNYREKDTE